MQNEKREIHTVFRRFPFFCLTKNLSLPALAYLFRASLELQFTSAGDGFRFAELWFGEFTFELFDMEEGFLEAELLDIIRQTRSGNLQIIVANNLGRKHWLWDAAFHMSEDYADFAAVLERIQKPKSLWDKLTKHRIQYEIYNRSTYRCILK